MKIDVKKILKSKTTAFAALVILIVIGFVGFFHYRDAVFSKEIVHLEIFGPKAVTMGQEFEYTVRYKNNSNFALEEVKVVFELPPNSLTEDSKLRLTQDMEDIQPGGQHSTTFKARLLGKEDDLKTARVWLSYVPHNLSARYESVAIFITKIDEVDIDVEFDLPEKMEKNKQITYALTYASQIDYPLENVSIKVDSLGGFEVASSEPESLDNAEWKLPVLQKGSKGRLSITGAAVADIGSHLNFSARLGMRVKGVFVVLKEIKEEVEVIQPSLVISQQVNDARPGETLNYQLTFKNTGSAPLDPMVTIAKLEGLALDFSTLQSTQGQVQVDHSIYFPLPTLMPGQETSVSFTVKLKDTIAESETLIKNTVTATGTTQIFETHANAGSPPPLTSS